MRAFAAESVDPQWSTATEAAVLGRIAEIPGAAYVSVNVECRTTLCLLQFVESATPVPNSGIAEVANLIKPEGLKSTWMIGIRVRGGAAVGIAYFQRDESGAAPTDADFLATLRTHVVRLLADGRVAETTRFFYALERVLGEADPIPAFEPGYRRAYPYYGGGHLRWHHRGWNRGTYRGYGPRLGYRGFGYRGYSHRMGARYSMRRTHSVALALMGSRPRLGDRGPRRRRVCHRERNPHTLVPPE